MSSVTRNLFKNGVASVLQKGVRLFDQILLVPFFISSWGAELYGEWLTLTVIPAMFGFTNLGFGSSFGNTFVLYYSSGNERKASSTSKSGLLLITWSILFASFIGTVSLLVISYLGLFEKLLVQEHVAVKAVSFLMLARLFDFFQSFYDSYYRALRKASIGINLVSFYALIKLIGGILVLINNGGIIAFSIVNLVTSITFNLLFAIIGTKMISLPNDRINHLSRNEIKDLVKKGLAYLMSPVWQTIFFQGTTLVVRILLGPTAVAVFNTVRTVTRSVTQTISMINIAVFPELQFELGEGRLTFAKRLFRLSIMIVFFISILGILFLITAGPYLYSIWTKNLLEVPSNLWNILILGIGFNSLWWVSSVVFHSKNEPFRFAQIGVISAILSVLISYFTTKLWGLTGAALGTVIFEILMLLFVIPESFRIIDQSFYSFFSDILKDLIFLKEKVEKILK